MVYDIYQDWCKRVNSSAGSTVSNEDSTTSCDFQLVDEHILKIFDGSSQEELTAQFIRNQAMKIASHLGLSDFNASSNWLARFLERHNRSSESFLNELRRKRESPLSDFPLARNTSSRNSSSRIQNFQNCQIFSKKWAKNVNRTHIARIKQNFKTAEQILHEDMVASITEDYHESSSRPTMVPQFSHENDERKLGVPLTHCPVIKKRKNSLLQADQPSTVIQTISDDSGDEQQRPIFKYGQPYSQMVQTSPPIDQQAAQILRCPQCSIILSSPEEFWGHLRENHYSILYSNACQPLLSPDSKGI
ncbi:Oidioi.mRNA.OKI2018_I69.chr1.g243.t1.cds [Oikopleura dioica]|uniref:Oidioi.mRNA.OKI2018_I69.chr1.g243.t1.cds n=1 Tax=Oikopleura dioica TaxID=34765 RepID=A0ABN7SJ82_OIKDI|nr:Oidioi.mRNA.OKI2018_I69.chr1.g243.t1.cds [Oikopleura dioica]